MIRTGIPADYEVKPSAQPSYLTIMRGMLAPDLLANVRDVRVYDSAVKQVLCVMIKRKDGETFTFGLPHSQYLARDHWAAVMSLNDDQKQFAKLILFLA